jgi:iron complex outermembrane recepter protein
MTKNLLWLSCATAALVLSAGAAQAATADASASATDSSQTAASVSELVVVAEHRETALQKIPVAVSVFTGAQRDLIGINTVQDVTNFAPGFTYDPGTVHAYIRGVGRQSVNVTDDQRVSTYEDEFVVYSPYGLDKSSLFLSQDQIERGPQNVGGRGAAAGSIDMISVRPTDHPYAELRLNVGNFGTYNVEGAVSGPVSDTLDLRLAFYDHNQDQGYYQNVVTPTDTEGNDIHEWYVEGQADWKPNDKFEFWSRVFDSGWNNRGDAGSRDGYANGSWDETSLTDLNAYVGGGLFVNPNYGYSAPNGNPTANAAAHTDIVPTSVTLYNPNFLNNPSMNGAGLFASPIERTVRLADYMGFNYNATYQFDDNIEFKYTGGIQNYNYRLNYNGTDSDVESFTLPGSTGNAALIGGVDFVRFPGCSSCSYPSGGALPAATLLPGPSPLVINPAIQAQYIEDDWWTAHDFSFQSTGKGPFQWIAGFFTYFQHYNQPYTVADTNQPQLSNPVYVPPSALISLSACGILGGFCGFSAPVAAPANPTDQFLALDYKFNVNNESLYSQFSYAFNDQFKFTGNLRYSYDDKWGTETARYVAFNNTIIDGFSPYYGEATPSVDATPGLVCLSGNPAACNSSTTLGKGVASMGVILPNGDAMRNLAGTSSAFTGGAGLEWTPTNDIFVYARYGRGYESMSFNAGQILANPEVSPEFLNSYEVGYKQTFGRNLSIDLAAFYYNYEGMQVPISINNGGVTQSQFVNVPNAVSEGVEFESTWSPVKDLVFVLSYSYDYTAVQTKCTGTVTGGVLTPATGSLCLLDTNDPAAIEAGANPFPGQTTASRDQGVNGNPLPDAPLNKVALSGSYSWHWDPGSLTVEGSYAYRSGQDGTLFDRYYDNAPGWSDVDARVTWKGPQDKYEVIGYVKNIFNSAQYDIANGGAGLAGNATSVSLPATGLNEVNIFTLAPPRTYGLEVRYKFF